jgi:hypothetical protein
VLTSVEAESGSGPGLKNKMPAYEVMNSSLESCFILSSVIDFFSS